MNSPLSDAAVVYNVRPQDPGSHVFDVTCRISEPDPKGQTFSMPTWIPGSYMIRDYARHVLSVEAHVDNETVPLRKLDKSTWHAGAVTGPLLLRAKIYANDLSVRGAYLDSEHGFFNGVCLFFQIHGMEDQRCVLHITPPKDFAEAQWTIATSMKRLTGDEGDFGAFVSENYSDLIDHPVLMGNLSICRFEAGGAEHVIAIVGRQEADLDRLEHDVQQLCSCHADFFGGPAPLDRYFFLLTVLNQGFGGLEHRYSSALICARDTLPQIGTSKVTSGYRKLLGLFSHEYFHLWNVKRIRPAEFASYDLSREAYTRQLWVFEGITSYYDDLLLLRSGLISVKGYLELLGRTLTSVYRSGGRRHQTLEDSSFDAWIKFYRQDENSPNAVVSYYTKGAMVALTLDLELRLRSAGKLSLDDVMRELWRRYGSDNSSGLPEDGFELLVEELSGFGLGEFFKKALRSHIDPPTGILLAKCGVRVHMRARESETDAGGKPGHREDRPLPWLGVRTQALGNGVIVKYVLADGPGMQAGLSPKDQLVALNGLRVTSTNLNTLLDNIGFSDGMEIDVFRRDELIRLTVASTSPPHDTCYLTVDEEADETAVLRRREWLSV